MENLNKENFWNSLMEKYPKAMREFYDWIDEYKKEIKWDTEVFIDTYANPMGIEFHDIPIDMQLGIILWYIELKEGETFSRDQYFQYMRARTTDFFIDREKTINNG